jgi:hypothetical protein
LGCVPRSSDKEKMQAGARRSSVGCKTLSLTDFPD